MSSSIIDFSDLAGSRIAQQYKDKPKYVELVKGLAGLAQSGIDDQLDNFITLYDIDLSEGHNLDVIGEIVGQDRVLVDYSDLEFFGYDGASNSGTYGDLNDSNIGSRYLSQSESIGVDVALSDPEYRIFIKARILKNYSTSTCEDIIKAAGIIFNSDSVELIEGDMSFSINVLSSADDSTIKLVLDNDILPRPSGVKLTGVVLIPPEITVSETGNSTVNSVHELHFATINGRHSWVAYISAFPESSYIRFTGVEWEIFHVSTGETWTLTSTSEVPEKTGWSVGSLGSPAPTLDY